MHQKQSDKLPETRQKQEHRAYKYISHYTIRFFFNLLFRAFESLSLDLETRGVQPQPRLIRCAAQCRLTGGAR